LSKGKGDGDYSYVFLIPLREFQYLFKRRGIEYTQAEKMTNQPEFLFAHWATPALKDLRGARWRALIERIAPLPSTHPDALALALVMARVSNCAACDARRYRERGGCAQCAQFVLTTLNKESEFGLLARFRAAQKEIARAGEICLERQAA
jgi:hypothetical protein